MIYTQKKDNFTITTNPDTFDLDLIHNFLTNSYWNRGAPKEVVVTSIKNSLCFGLFEGDNQIGFAGVVTDYAHFAYIQDVFVLEAYRGRGLGQWLMECIIACPSLKGVRRILLGTRDAQAFYKKVGFKELATPDQWLELLFDREWYRPK